jgi:hypothetical protein
MLANAIVEIYYSPEHIFDASVGIAHVPLGFAGAVGRHPTQRRY